jgi:hypothetical protein
MRSTLVLQDVIMVNLKEIAAQEHKSLKAVINDTLALGLGRKLPSKSKWKCPSYDMGGRLDYQKAWETIDNLEAQAVAEKLDLRK